jgi:biopolymer transport protein ExbD
VKIRTGAASEEEFVIPLTSMTDIIFLLLLFYMVCTTSFEQERALDVKLPAAESSDEPPPRELVISVLEDGRVILNGAEVSHEALIDSLRSTAAAAPETPVTIRGHRAARHEAIVGVMDACGLAGLTNLSVGTVREERG